MGFETPQPPISRRDLLSRLVSIIAAAFGVSLGAGCPGGSSYRKAQADESDSPEGLAGQQQGKRLEFKARFTPRYGVKEITVTDRSAYLVHNYDPTTKQDIWLAIDRRCTHTGCKVSYAKDEHEFQCPCHGSRFDISGYPLSGPAKQRLRTWPTEVINELVYVLLED